MGYAKEYHVERYFRESLIPRIAPVSPQHDPELHRRAGARPAEILLSRREPMPRISGKRAFLELLKQEGVEVLFGNPGTTELPLMDAFAVERDIRYVLALQEAAAMAMADGYAQASGKLAVVNVHVAPGLGNAMGMLYDAQKAAAPDPRHRRPARPGLQRHRADPLGRPAAGSRARS